MFATNGTYLERREREREKRSKKGKEQQILKNQKI
jgi:hypothetical protein